MSKRYFKIYTGRYGGELTVGSVDEAFVEYWKHRVEEDGDSELIETLQKYEWDDEDMGDADSPIPKEDYNAWHDCDEHEHVNGPFEDNQFTVTEITLHPDAEYKDGTVQWKEGVEHDYSTRMYEEVTDEEQHYDYTACVYSREAYTTEVDEELETVVYEPVLCFFSSEKGCFGEVYVETDGEDFDPEKLQTGVLETDLANIIEAYWYDRKPLQIDFNYADTTGKGYYATVGYMNTKWHDDRENWLTYDYTETADLKQAFDEHYSNL